MIRILLLLGVGASLTACATRSETISSMNYVRAPIDPVCVHATILSLDGFGVRTPIYDVRDTKQITAFFNETTEVTTIMRNYANGGAEVAVFSRVPEGASPLVRDAAAYAVKSANDAIARQCTLDGGDGQVVLEAQ